MKSGTCDLWLVDFYFLGWLWKPSFATQQKSWFPRFGKAVVLWLDSKIHSFRDIVSTCFHYKAPWIPWQELAGHAITLDFRWFSNGLVSILDQKKTCGNTLLSLFLSLSLSFSLSLWAEGAHGIGEPSTGPFLFKSLFSIHVYHNNPYKMRVTCVSLRFRAGMKEVTPWKGHLSLEKVT